jgi:ArsR family transcriptional regulator
MTNVEELFRRAISDPTRYQIMMMLCCVWLSVNDVVDKLDGKVKQPTVSHHLKELEEANLVLLREEGRYRYYTLNREHYNVCCGMLVRAGNPGYDMQLVPVGTIPVNAIKVSGS